MRAHLNPAVLLSFLGTPLNAHAIVVIWNPGEITLTIHGCPDTTGESSAISMTIDWGHLTTSGADPWAALLLVDALLQMDGDIDDGQRAWARALGGGKRQPPEFLDLVQSLFDSARNTVAPWRPSPFVQPQLPRSARSMLRGQLERAAALAPQLRSLSRALETVRSQGVSPLPPPPSGISVKPHHRALDELSEDQCLHVAVRLVRFAPDVEPGDSLTLCIGEPGTRTFVFEIRSQALGDWTLLRQLSNCVQRARSEQSGLQSVANDHAMQGLRSCLRRVLVMDDEPEVEATTVADAPSTRPPPGQNIQSHRVFISYRRGEDASFAKRVADLLRSTGEDPFLDLEARPTLGRRWRDELTKAIENCDYVLAVVGRGYTASRYCKWELEEATRLGKRVVPLSCSPPPRNAEVRSPLQELDLGSRVFAEIAMQSPCEGRHDGEFGRPRVPPRTTQTERRVESVRRRQVPLSVELPALQRPRPAGSVDPGLARTLLYACEPTTISVSSSERDCEPRVYLAQSPEPVPIESDATVQVDPSGIRLRAGWNLLAVSGACRPEGRVPRFELEVPESVQVFEPSSLNG